MAQGTEVYPPAVPQALSPNCPPPDPYQTLPLAPHGLRTDATYVVLRGSVLIADVTIIRHGTLFQFSTPPLHLRLTKADPPQVRVYGGRAPSAVVTRPAYASGPMLYVDGFARFAQHGTVGNHGFVGVIGFGNTWLMQHGTILRERVHSPYKRVVEWHAVAGWLNHSVASINFNQP